MRIETSYLVKTINDVVAWLAVGKEVPSGAIILEERPMILPDEGKVLRHKATGEESTGHWLRDGSADDWEEIEGGNDDETHI